VQREELDERLQGDTQRGGRNRGIAPESQIPGVELVAEPEPEIVVVRETRALFEKAAEGVEAERQRWRAGHFRRDAGVPEDAIDITVIALDPGHDAGRGRSQNARLELAS
jgi:hypothetical protein